MVFDQLGISKILPDSSTNPQNIFITKPVLNSRFSSGGLLKDIHDSDGAIAFTSGNNIGKLKFKTTSGYASGKVNKNHSECAANGFMQDAKDFRNVEFSCSLFLVNSNSAGFFRTHLRGGEHIGIRNCESSAIGIDLGFDGRIRAMKSRRYNDVSSYSNWKPGIGDLEGRWIGYKVVVYNVHDNKGVMYRLYLDTNNDSNWVKYFELVDDGTGILGGNGSVCDGVIGQPVTWGGPIVWFTWVGATDPDGVKIKNISIREIDATGVGGSPSIPAVTPATLQRTTALLPTVPSNKSGNSPANCDMWGVLAAYATGEIRY